MRHVLVPHPDHPMPAVEKITVDLVRDGDTVMITYRVNGAIEKLVFAPEVHQERTDRLWQNSCFEIFVRIKDQRSYHEYNFAPTTHWAAYGFADRRHGMYDLKDVATPHIQTHINDQGFMLQVAATGVIPAEHNVEIGLSVIIEDKDGAHSYWALAHPTGQADFHNDVCFALSLPHEETV